MSKPTLCIDFDGVIHSYEHGWRDGSIYGTLVPGFAAWAMHAAQHFELVVYSARSATPEGRDAMRAWMRGQLAERMMPHEIDQFLAIFQFAHEKPKAYLTIDDRCVRFDGDWSARNLQPGSLLGYKPWNEPKPKGPTLPFSGF